MNRNRRQLTRYKRRQAAFSLVEVLVAMTIFGFVTLASGFALTTALRSQATMRQRADMLQEMRGIASVLAHDLRFAYASTNNPNTIFVTGGSAPGSLLTFSTLSGRIAMPDTSQPDTESLAPAEYVSPPQSGLRTITYAHDPSSGTLMRIESVVPGTDAAAMAANAAGMPQTVLSRRVRNITFEFYDSDNQTLRQDWTYSNDPELTQGAEGTQTTDTSLPQSVHVEIELVGSDGRIVDQTIVIPLATPTPAPAGQTPPVPVTTNPGGNPGGNPNGNPNGKPGGNNGGNNQPGPLSLPGLGGMGPLP